VIESFLSHAVLVALRIGGLMTFAPFFSQTSVSVHVKAALTVALTVLLLPLYTTGNLPPATVSAAGWLGIALSEAALGLMAGFTTQFVFDGMELAGQLVGFQFGFSLVNVIDPNSEVEITVLSSFHELVTLLIFVQLGVHRALLRAAAVSFDLIPPGTSFVTHIPAAEVLKMAGAFWLIGAEIAFPVLLATLLSDLAIGYMSKASPQFPALFVGLSVKVLLGLAVLFGAVAVWPGILEHHFLQALTNLEKLLAVSR
jgi:flagellar biosynthetic protein FliR